MAKITDKWKQLPADAPSPTQFSLRPTITMAAQIHALTTMFPNRTKTEIINDLISIGLKQVIEEITDESTLYMRLGEDLTLDDYGPEGRQFCELFQAELKALQAKATQNPEKAK